MVSDFVKDYISYMFWLSFFFSFDIVITFPVNCQFPWFPWTLEIDSIKANIQTINLREHTTFLTLTFYASL